jgi:hypothetical protein
MKEIAKSYARAVTVAVLPLLTMGEDKWQYYLAAVLLAMLGPGIRALDIEDQAFGFRKHD